MNISDLIKQDRAKILGTADYDLGNNVLDSLNDDNLPYAVLNPFVGVVNNLSTDTVSRYNQILEDEKLYKIYKAIEWDETPIEYRINKYGFREEELKEDQGGVICIGDSHTTGVGLHLNETWPKMLEAEIGKKCWNLSKPAGGLDYAFRILFYWLPRLKCKTVFLQASATFVREFYTNDGFYEAGNWNSNPEFYSRLYEKPLEYSMNYIKSLYGIKHLCQEYGIELHTITFDNYNRLGFSVLQDLENENYYKHMIAKDFLHTGVGVQAGIKDLFLEKLNGKA